MNKAPNFSAAEDAILREGWPGGWSIEKLKKALPGRRAQSFAGRALKLGVKRPDWYIVQMRKAGRDARAAKLKGRMIWSETATTRLVDLANKYGPSEAARIMRIDKSKAEGRLHRIGWKANKPKQPVKAASEDLGTLQPQPASANRMAALMERAREMGISP